jgi:hypothetical protein
MTPIAVNGNKVMEATLMSRMVSSTLSMAFCFELGEQIASPLQDST